MKQWDTARLLWTGLCESLNYTKSHTPDDPEINEMIHKISNDFQVMVGLVDERAKAGHDDAA